MRSEKGNVFILGIKLLLMLTSFASRGILVRFAHKYACNSLAGVAYKKNLDIPLLKEAR